MGYTKQKLIAIVELLSVSLFTQQKLIEFFIISFIFVLFSSEKWKIEKKLTPKSNKIA